jgi:hypothetical protein
VRIKDGWRENKRGKSENRGMERGGEYMWAR